MTGNLGNVMKESATISLEYIKAKHESLGISLEDIENKTSTFTFQKVPLRKMDQVQELQC